MAIREHDWDGDLRRRAKEEDCPIPQGFSERLEARLEGLPQGTGPPEAAAEDRAGAGGRRSDPHRLRGGNSGGGGHPDPEPLL